VQEKYSDFKVKKAIEIIGANDNKNKTGVKQGSYKNGIVLIRESLAKKGIRVTNRELKLFARLVIVPFYNRSWQRISSNTVSILQEIYDQIHVSEELIENCYHSNGRPDGRKCKISLFSKQEQSIIANGDSINKVLDAVSPKEREKFDIMLAALYHWASDCP
jgi:hypothetical protein